MADDDLFLDDEAEETAPKPKPKPKAKSKGKGGAKKSSSAEKSAKVSKAEESKVKKESVAMPADDSQNISLWAASALVICAFVIGFAAGGIIFGGGSQPATTPTPATGGLPGGGTQAPPLTQQQQQGGMPKGHPAVPGAPGSDSTSTKSGTKSGGSK